MCLWVGPWPSLQLLHSATPLSHHTCPFDLALPSYHLKLLKVIRLFHVHVLFLRAPSRDVRAPSRQSCLPLREPMGCGRQAPQSGGLSRQEYRSELRCPSPGDLPDPGIDSSSPELQVDSLLTEPSTYGSLFIVLVFPLQNSSLVKICVFYLT